MVFSWQRQGRGQLETCKHLLAQVHIWLLSSLLLHLPIQCLVEPKLRVGSTLSPLEGSAESHGKGESPGRGEELDMAHHNSYKSNMTHIFF